jgi:uncharacterized protein YycO
MITLRFSGGLGVAGRVIQAATWSWCSHVDFVMADSRLLGAVPGHGVCIREPEADAGRVEVYQADIPDWALAYATSQVGQPYDWAGVLGWVVHRDWQEADSWFCSELIAWSCQSAGHPLVRADRAWRITPRDLLLSPYLIPVPAHAGDVCPTTI